MPITSPDLVQNGILNIYNFIIAISAGLLCDKAGRRPLFLASTIGAQLHSSTLSNTELKTILPARHDRLLDRADHLLRYPLGDG